MIDPYLLAGGQCLANKLGLTNAEELRLTEGRIVSIRDVELARETLPGEYNLQHLQASIEHSSVMSTLGPARLAL